MKIKIIKGPGEGEVLDVTDESGECIISRGKGIKITDAYAEELNSAALIKKDKEEREALEAAEAQAAAGSELAAEIEAEEIFQKNKADKEKSDKEEQANEGIGFVASRRKTIINAGDALATYRNYINSKFYQRRGLLGGTA